MNEKPNLLIVGAASSTSSLLSQVLAKDYNLVGIDIRPLRNPLFFPGEFTQIAYSKREIREIFNKYKFSSMIHMGRITATQKTSTMQKFHENVVGLKNLLQCCVEFQVKNVVVISTHLVYGAHTTNHLYITEAEPLKAAATFNKLASSVEFDHSANQFMWEHREIKTVVLRPVFVAGSTVRNGMMAAFKSNYCPSVFGYDPLVQFMHENDFVHAVELALKGEQRGVYNVAGEGVISFRDAIIASGSIPLPIPYHILKLGQNIIDKMPWKAPAHLVDYFRYPVVVSDQLFRNTFGFKEKYNTIQALKSIND